MTLASMGPRLINRGNEGLDSAGLKNSMLQWGRG